jgi:hypothetical protein
MYAIFTCLPELEAVELVVLLALVAAGFAAELVVELLELDDPHAARNSVTAATPTDITVLLRVRERDPAVLLMGVLPPRPRPAKPRRIRSVPSHLSTGRNAGVDSSVT